MVSLCLSPARLFSPNYKSPPNPSLSPSPSNSRLLPLYPSQKLQRKKIHRSICRADLSNEAPFAAAIGACLLSSLVLPVASDRTDEDEEDSTIDSTDTRFAVMGIISFIPYFNWLSWIFAWLDTGKRRYAVYSIVYLLPYLRSNLSISPEESWLPITSILLCILHVQLEASIRNGDVQGFQLFNEAAKELKTRKKQRFQKDSRSQSNEGGSLPSKSKKSRDALRGWETSEDHKELKEDWEDKKKK